MGLFSGEQGPAYALPLHLSEYAIHDYNMTQYADSGCTLKQDGFYGNVNLVNSSSKSSFANITTYRIIFEASMPADKTTQTFITKISLSFSDPPPSTVKIRFRSVKIKGKESDYEDSDDEEEEDEEEDNLSDIVCYEDEPEINSESDVEDHSQNIHLEDSESVVEDHSQKILLEVSESVVEDYSQKLLLIPKNIRENISSLGDRVHGESLSESDDDKHSKVSEFFESDEKHSKDAQERLSKSDEKHSKDSKEDLSECDERCSKDSEEINLSKFCDGEPSKDSGENLSEFDNVKHSKDSKEYLSESKKKDTKTGVRYYCHVDTNFTPMEQKYKGSELSKEIESFRRDVGRSDGFEVGHYPLMDAAGIHGTWIYKFYDRENAPLGPSDMNELVCLSRLAICIYNMKKNTRFGNVKVLKAMTFGGTVVGYNITFEASLPDKTTETFRTRIFTDIPVPYAKIKIEFVKVKPN